METEFKIGQRVFSTAHWEWGEIMDVITTCDTETILFLTEASERYYAFNLDGSYIKGAGRALYFDKPTLSDDCFEAKRWRAKTGENYFNVNSYGVIRKSTECFWDIDNERYRVGNYFKTSEEAEKSELYKLFNRIE